MAYLPAPCMCQADRHASDHGVLILTAEERAEMERERDAMTGGQLRLIDLAVAADQRWLGVLPGFGVHRQEMK